MVNYQYICMNIIFSVTVIIYVIMLEKKRKTY